MISTKKILYYKNKCKLNICKSKHLLIALVLFYSCQNTAPVYEQAKEFANAEWIYSDSFTAQFHSNDTTSLYCVLIHLKPKLNYLYRNIYLQYSYKGDTILKSVPLFDQTGKPLGNWGGREYTEVVDTLIQDYKFDSINTEFNFKLKQYMRVDTLKDMLEAKLEVHKY